MTYILVIYSKNQKVRRRLVKCEHESHYSSHKNIHPGENFLEIPVEIYDGFKSPNELDDYIASQIGQKQSDRCAVLCHKEGVCLHIINADPEIDFHPDGKIIAHEKIALGEKP